MKPMLALAVVLLVACERAGTTARSAFDGVLHLARYDQPGVDGSTLVTGPSIERPNDYAVSSVADNVLGRTLFSPAAEQLQVVEEGAQVAVWLQERDDAGIRTLRRILLTTPLSSAPPVDAAGHLAPREKHK